MLSSEELPQSKTVATPQEPPSPSPYALADEVVLCDQKIVVNDKPLAYDVHAGALTVKGKDEKDTANLYYIAYFAKTSGEQSSRPIAFCFNGGPGSSSIWLHMGFLGPKIVDIEDLAHPPLYVGYKDNPLSLLEVADLIFIDPVSTGFSHAVNTENAKNFYDVGGDVHSIADFLRLFLTKFNRWQSPKLLIGESYGTFRAVSLAHFLQEKFYIDINGIVLISLILDVRTCDDSPLCDLTSLTNLPSFAAIAQYHHRLKGLEADMPVTELMQEAKRFAVEEYGPALSLGTTISPERKERIANRLSELTSLPASFFLASNLRLPSERSFSEELLKDQQKIIGRFDGRMTCWTPPEDFSMGEHIDPSFYSISGAFTSAFHAYLSQDLKWQKEVPYNVLNPVALRSWNWAIQGTPAGLGYASMLGDLHLSMLKNPNLKVFVAAGYYDLATPFYSQEYTLSHALLRPDMQKNLVFKGYVGGHMMYLNEASKKDLHDDLVQFISSLGTKS